MNSTNANQDKKRLEFLKEISLVKARLFRPGIESEFVPDERKKKFKKLRLEWSRYVETVQIDILTVLVDRLEENESAFEEGIRSIETEIQEIDNAVEFLKSLERGLEILGRIVDLTI